MAPTPSHPLTCLLECSLPSTLAIKSPADPTNTAADIAASSTMVTIAQAPCPMSSEVPVSSPVPPPQTPSENGALPVKANTSPFTPAKATPSLKSPASASTRATMATAQAPTGPPAPAPSKASGPDTSLASKPKEGSTLVDRHRHLPKWLTHISTQRTEQPILTPLLQHVRRPSTHP